MEFTLALEFTFSSQLLRNTIPILYKSKAAQLILDAAEIIMAEA